MATIEENREHVVDDLEERLKSLDSAEDAVDRAYATGRAERARITQAAQLDAAEAVAMAGIAMEADQEADEAMRISVIAEKMGDREKAKSARKRERAARKKAAADHKAATNSAKQAYDAIRFSAPNKMGFMRVVQVLFALHIASVIVYLMLTSRDAMTYNVTNMMDWVMVILEGVAFWMFINRYKVARPFVMIMAAVGLVVPVVADLVIGTFNPFALVNNGIFYLFLLIYFATSKRVKATLVNDLSKNKGDYEKDTFVIERRGWPFVRNLIMYFILFSILGHWMEMGMCQFIILGLVQGEYDPSNTMLWRDWLYPFPMEGAAVVVIALVLYPFYLWLKEKVKPRALAYFVSFLSNALLCTVIEFSMGLLVNADLQLWDYTDNFCNIMGQVCLQNTMAFGVAASLITWFVYPLLERWIARVRPDIMNIVFVVVAVFGAIVWSLYLITPTIEVQQGVNAALREQVVTSDDRVVALDDGRHANDRLRQSVEASDDLTEEQKAKLLAEIDSAGASIDAMDAEVRNILNAHLDNLEAASASSAAASGASASSEASADASASSASASPSSAGAS